MGTRFMLSRECVLAPEIQKRFLEAKGRETVLVERGASSFARVLPLTDDGRGYGCGQVVGLIHDVSSVRQIIDRILSLPTIPVKLTQEEISLSTPRLQPQFVAYLHALKDVFICSNTW